MTMLETVTSAPVTRRTLVKGAGTAGVGLTLGHVGRLRAAAQDSESVQDIVNVLATAESLAVTLYGSAIESANNDGYDTPLSEIQVRILDAARAEEQYHLDYLLAAKAEPLTQSFTIPDDAILTSYETLFGTLLQLETAFVAAYAAATRQFAVLKEIELVKVAYQAAATEAEHRVLANYALGKRPPNNVAYEAALYGSVAEAAQGLTDLGFIGGGGTAIEYPGPGEINGDGVGETTPGGQVVDCPPSDLPPTGVGSSLLRPDGLSGIIGFLGLFGAGAAAAGLALRLSDRAKERAEA